MLEYEEVEHEEAWLVVEGKCVCEGVEQDAFR